MPTTLQHKEKYEHNRAFGCEPIFSSGCYNDWKVVCIFYEAVHIVEAYFGITNNHPYGHKERASLISKDSLTKEIKEAYDDLYSLSCQARYKTWKISTRQICDAEFDMQAISARIIPAIEHQLKSK